MHISYFKLTTSTSGPTILRSWVPPLHDSFVSTTTKSVYILEVERSVYPKSKLPYYIPLATGNMQFAEHVYRFYKCNRTRKSWKWVINIVQAFTQLVCVSSFFFIKKASFRISLNNSWRHFYFTAGAFIRSYFPLEKKWSIYSFSFLKHTSSEELIIYLHTNTICYGTVYSIRYYSQMT